MLSIFRTNQILNGILLLPYVIILHLSVFFISDSWQPESAGIFSNWIYSWLGMDNIILSNIFAIILLWLQSFLINQIALQHRLINENSLFPGLFYILLCSLIPDFLHLSPVLMGNTFFIISLWEILGASKKNAVAGKIFNAGFWIGIAGLFYFSFTYLIIWVVLGLNSIRSLKVAEFFQALFGLLIAFLLTGTAFHWFGKFDVLWTDQFLNNFAFIDLNNFNTTQTYIKGGLIIFLILIMSLSLSKFVSKKIMQVRKKIIVLYNSLFVIAGTLLFQANVNLEHLLIFMVPLSYFVAIYFITMKRNFAETLHFILLILAIAFQFSPMLGL